MKIFTFTYNINLAIIIWMCSFQNSFSQIDSSNFIKRINADTSKQLLNMDAAYNRPFLQVGKLPVALGGYLETNSQYVTKDGISDGINFQARRFTLFFSSSIAQRIKFLSELEFEDGTKEINIEFAAIDIEFHPLLILRGGIIMNPIGAFNQNHDGPKWDFIDRPILATNIIPTTLSNAGFGIHGKCFYKNWILGYETYISNGFDDRIISNTNGRTFLGASKLNVTRFEESNSGLPTFTAKTAIRNRNIGEIGFSFLSGVYNKWQEDGLILDIKRSVNIYAIDFNSTLFKNRLSFSGEFAQVGVDIPYSYTQQYGSKQFGGYLDIIGKILHRKILGWEKANLNMGLRIEYADFNKGNFRETGENIRDDIWALVPGIALRPVGTTIIRFNYRIEKHHDLFGNPPLDQRVIQFGFSTYF